MSFVLFSAEEILGQLDRCAAAFTFPVLDNGYVYPADVRMSLYRDEARWAMVIEVLGYNVHMGGVEGIDNCLYCFGNCLGRKPGLSPEDTLRPVTNVEGPEGPEGPVFGEHDAVHPQATALSLRGRRVEIPRDPEHYRRRGIELEAPPRLRGFELLRALLPEQREELLASEQELRARVPRDLPLLLRLDEWKHPDLSDGDTPGEAKAFQLLARALEEGDATLYRTKSKPNTHWKNWPDAGTL
jgi:hypothetical protein